jgi:hypothetical protein
MLKTFTTSDELFEVLNGLMKVPSLANFRLVGGTALSLLYGHRISEDIDLFASQEYGSIDFNAIENDIRQVFPLVTNDDRILDLPVELENHFGLQLHIGTNENSSIKTDILNWTTADFIFPIQNIEGIRLATAEEIALMKLDAISRGGRKKDFWDMSEIQEHLKLVSLLKLYPKKYPYNNIKDVIKGLTDFTVAEEMPDPICLKGKHWDLIKREMQETVINLQ